MRAPADAVTALRFPLAAALATVALVGGADTRRWLVLLALVAAGTDVADGWLARRTGTASANGALLDSLADGALALALAVALAVVVEAWPAWVLAGIAAVIALRIVAAARQRWRGQPAIGHSALNKAAGIAALAATCLALATGDAATWLTAGALAIALSAALAEGGTKFSRRDGNT